MQIFTPNKNQPPRCRSIGAVFSRIFFREAVLPFPPGPLGTFLGGFFQIYMNSFPVQILLGGLDPLSTVKIGSAIRQDLHILGQRAADIINLGVYIPILLRHGVHPPFPFGDAFVSLCRGPRGRGSRNYDILFRRGGPYSCKARPVPLTVSAGIIRLPSLFS